MPNNHVDFWHRSRSTCHPCSRSRTVLNRQRYPRDGADALAFFVGGCGASVGGELTLAIKGGKGDEGDPKQHAPRHKPPRHGLPGGYCASPAGVRPRDGKPRASATRRWWPRLLRWPGSDRCEPVKSTALKMAGRPCSIQIDTATWASESDLPFLRYNFWTFF